MSRKNRNAAHRKYDRFPYGKGSMLDKPNANARESVLDNSNHNRSGSIEETTMINERVGYTYKFLSSSSLETDASYQRRVNEAQVDRIIAEFNPLLVNAVKPAADGSSWLSASNGSGCTWQSCQRLADHNKRFHAQCLDRSHSAGHAFGHAGCG